MPENKFVGINEGDKKIPGHCSYYIKDPPKSVDW